MPICNYEGEVIGVAQIINKTNGTQEFSTRDVEVRLMHQVSVLKICDSLRSLDYLSLFSSALFSVIFVCMY
jgi:hypothetical protein